MKAQLAAKDLKMATLQEEIKGQMSEIQRIEARRLEQLEREQAAIVANLKDATSDMQTQMLTSHAAHRFSRQLLVVCVILAVTPATVVIRLQTALDGWRLAWRGRRSGFRVLSRVGNSLNRCRVVHWCVTHWRAQKNVAAVAALLLERDTKLQQQKKQDRAFLLAPRSAEPPPLDPYKSPKMVGQSRNSTSSLAIEI